jgi:hypothetical protein
MQMKTLHRLWSVADQEAKKLNSNPLFIFDPIGLILARPLKKMQYESTPINSSAFAHTGGDGVHFSFLHLDGKPSESSPIVMTVPMQSAGKENLIVGENLFEFLCLGERIGYFRLEQLVYDESRTIEWISNPAILYELEYGKRLSNPSRVDSYNKEKYLLKILRDEFGLKSWSNVKKRLGELQSSYISLLEFRSSFTNNQHTG